MFLSFSFILLSLSALRGEDSKDPKVIRQLKIKITSPKPGSTLKGKIQLLWEVETPCHPPKDEQTKTQDPSTTTQEERYVVQYFVDYQLVGENTSDDTPFELDTKLFKNGVHTITVNVADEHPHVASYSVKVKFKN